MTKHYKIKAETGHYDTKEMQDKKSFNIIIKPEYDNWKFAFYLSFLKTGFHTVQFLKDNKVIIQKNIFVFLGHVNFNIGKENALKAGEQYQLTIY